MRYSVEIEINAPLNEVVKRFEDPELMKEWMPGLVSFEHLSGELGKVGAKSKLTYQMGKRKIEMIETITEIDLPRCFNGTYETNGVYNEVGNSFEAIDENKTKHTSQQYFNMKGSMKVIGWLFPKAFKKQSYKYLEDFKNFVERDYKG